MDVKLVMFKPNGQRKDIAVPKALVVLGRGENCDIQIPLENVSRRHCELSVDGEQVKVKDLASSNGTYVNNRRVNETTISAGDRLVIGPVVFTLQIDGKPETIEPLKPGEKAAEEKAGAEEVVELEADVVDDSSSSEDVLAAALGSDSAEDQQDLDPIAALEALAAEGQKKKKDDE